MLTLSVANTNSVRHYATTSRPGASLASNRSRSSSNLGRRVLKLRAVLSGSLKFFTAAQTFILLIRMDLLQLVSLRDGLHGLTASGAKFWPMLRSAIPSPVPLLG
jgi:hypothetical protein